MIWSLITSNTTGSETDDEPDDELIEYINRPKSNLRGNVFSGSSPASDMPNSRGPSNLEARVANSKEFRLFEKW
jgi:hypothetical protein